MPSSTSPALDGLLAKLQQVRPSGDGFVALCPAHGDKHHSLSIHEKGDHILVKCFIGCTTQNIVSAIGMEMKDLFVNPSGNGSKPVAQAKSPVVKETVWEIKDPDGKVVAEHIRLDHEDGSKSFVWKREGKKGLDGLSTSALPLYGIDRLMTAASDTDIIICEGEKAADAVQKLGRMGLGTVTGASGSPSPDSLTPLVGFTGKVYLWPDHDEPGRKHMEKVAAALYALGKHAHIVNWTDAPPKGDAADFPADESLELLLWEAPQFLPPQKASNTDRFNSVTQTVTKSVTQNVTETVTRAEIAKQQAKEALAHRVLEWVKGSVGWWSADELDRDIGIMAPTGKANRRLILHRLREQGIVEQHARINKQFRYVDLSLTALDFKTVGRVGALPFRWPMGIERLVNLYPGNLCVIAGSPNSGKTALMLQLLYLNQHEFAPMYYWCSEMGGEELNSRLVEFADMPDIEGWVFKPFERASSFQDVIVPDCVNLVDYLEMTDELWMVNAHLTAIQHKIGRGLAVVALQKKKGADYGRGQEFSLEKPKLYLSLDRGRLKIIKGKSWVNKHVDPNGLEISFKIVNGCDFVVSRDWHTAGGFDPDDAPPPQTWGKGKSNAQYQM